MTKKAFRIYCMGLISSFLIILYPAGVSVKAAGTQQAPTSSQPSSYFNESACLAYGQSFISETVSNGVTTAWTPDTKPSNITVTYDTDGNPNAYIVNLQTNNEPSGYLLIEAFTAGEPNIMEYGYSGVYYLTNGNHFGNIRNQKIIYTGNRGFFTKSNNQYYKAENGTKINISADTIKKNYFNGIKSENDYLKKSDLK